MGRSFGVQGQVTFEFIISVVIILGIFVIGLTIFSARQDLNTSFSNNWALENFAFKVSRNVNNAALLDDNSSIRDIIIFDKSGADIVVSGNVLSVSTASVYVSAVLATSRVSFLVTDFNGPVFFKKINGVVVVDYS